MAGKTVDQVWKEIRQVQKKSYVEEAKIHQREPTLGELTLQEFLNRAGLVDEASKAPMELQAAKSHQREPTEMTVQEFLNQQVLVPEASKTPVELEAAKSNQREPTLCEMSLDDFLVRAGVVDEASKTPTELQAAKSHQREPTVMTLQEFLNRAGVVSEASKTAMQLETFEAEVANLRSFPLQMGLSPSLSVVPLSNPVISGRKRDADAIENGTESMPRTKIKIRESGDKKQDYQNELGGKVSGSEEENLKFTREEKIFENKEALIRWTHEVGRKNGFVIVIKRSDSGDRGQKARITFCCERGGKHRNTRKIKKDERQKQLRNTGTKKCECPFTLKGYKLDDDDKWRLKVVSGEHNHKIVEHCEGRSYAGRLSKEETSLSIHMSKNMVSPKDILATLKHKDAENTSTVKQIYNMRHRYKVIEMASRSQMQQLLSKLSEHKYIEWHESFDGTDIIKDLFWAHPVSIDLMRAFPYVLLMDCTCKTNRSNLPLLEVIGVTSTNITFAIAFAYLESEQDDNYSWALERLRSLMHDTVLPNVIISDGESALMNAVERVFPTTKHLLCRRHISMNLLTNCKKLFATNDVWKKFRMSWDIMVLSSNEDEFVSHLDTLKQEFSSYPQAIEYVTNTWLNNYKERFVSAWTDKIMHLGILTANRVGSSHSRLKKQLHSSQEIFETSWLKIHSLLMLQRSDIITSFEKSLKAMPCKFKSMEFEELQGFISIVALHIVYSELKRANVIGVDASICRCTIRRTHGLPCAHEIAEFKREGRPIPLESIDIHWRKLDLAPVFKKQKVKLSCESEFHRIAKHFNESDDDTKLLILKKLAEIVDPQTKSLLEPITKQETWDQPNSKVHASLHGDHPTCELVLSRQEKNCSLDSTVAPVVSTRPIAERKEEDLRSEEKEHGNKRSTFISSLPVKLQPYIYYIKDVAADGNCGFRAIADLVGYGENGWKQVRKDLLDELNSNFDYYGGLYGISERVYELRHALSYSKSCPSFVQYWMTMPDMGHLIATKYNVVLFHLSWQQSFTFLPLRSEPILARKEIAIGFVNNNHFVEVFLCPDHPIPPIVAEWHAFHDNCANGWDTMYISRIQHLKKIVDGNVAIIEIINDEVSLVQKMAHGNGVNHNSKTEAEPSSGKPVEQNSQPPEPPKQDYIDVRAREGQAADSHSLAELITGKAQVLDEIIGYIQSLQRQVEFLSMKLEAADSRMNPGIGVFPFKN